MKHNFFYIFILILITSTGVMSQSENNSPYSRYGIGDLVNPNFYHIQQMGSIGQSYFDPYAINTVNPATYSRLSSTSFAMGVYGQQSKLMDNQNTDATNWSGNLEYMALAFPLYNPLNRILDREEADYNLGMAFALRPVSRVNYNITTVDSTETKITRNYSGSGGTYEFLWGNSFRYKGLSIGLNLSYIFGNIEYSRNTDFNVLPLAFNNRFTSDYNVGGFRYNVGALYHMTLNKKALKKKDNVTRKSLSIGLTFNTATSFNTSSDVLNRVVQAGGDIDTIQNVYDQSGSGKLPANVGFGITYYHGSKFAWGIDYEQNFWSQYENEATGEDEGTLNDGFKISTGGYYRPNFQSYNNFFERVYYKLGFNYAQDPRVVNGEQVDRWSVTTGLGLPFVFQRKLSLAHIGFEYGKIGSATPIKEDFFKITLGFNFNDDEWFLKRKYN